MADVAAPRSIPLRGPTGAPVQSTTLEGIRKGGHLSLDIASPVTQNGSFEFDRVLKSGELLKRNKKTKVWKPVYFVLRRNVLSMYKDPEETKLRHQIILSDITAVARQKDPKRKGKHVFGLFSPSRNFHLEASTELEAQHWVDIIRREARIDEEEAEMIMMSPGGAKHPYQGFGRRLPQGISEVLSRHEPRASSSSEEEYKSPNAKPIAGAGALQGHVRKLSGTHVDYSGPDHGSYSDVSDSTGPGGFQDPSISSLRHDRKDVPPTRNAPRSHPLSASQRLPKLRNVSQMSVIDVTGDDERVVWHGYLYLLKSRSGVRQWKKLWVVLRPKALAMYKNEEEYSALLIIPFSTILDAVEIDPVSKSKQFCLQIITEERNYRFAAPDEEALNKWLGGLKSLLAKRKEADIQQRAAGVTR